MLVSTVAQVMINDISINFKLIVDSIVVIANIRNGKARSKCKFISVTSQFNR